MLFRCLVLTALVLFAFLLPPALRAASRPDASGVLDLNGPWMMKDFERGTGASRQLQMPGNMPADCIPCRVPGTVRTSLLEAHLIPDPYYGYDNEKSLWVEGKEWWFFKTFTTGEAFRGKWTDLVFEGMTIAGPLTPQCVTNNGPLISGLSNKLTMLGTNVVIRAALRAITGSPTGARPASAARSAGAGPPRAAARGTARSPSRPTDRCSPPSRGPCCSRRTPRWIR